MFTPKKTNFAIACWLQNSTAKMTSVSILYHTEANCFLQGSLFLQEQCQGRPVKMDDLIRSKALSCSVTENDDNLFTGRQVMKLYQCCYCSCAVLFLFYFCFFCFIFVFLHFLFFYFMFRYNSGVVLLLICSLLLCISYLLLFL